MRDSARIGAVNPLQRTLVWSLCWLSLSACDPSKRVQPKPVGPSSSAEPAQGPKTGERPAPDSHRTPESKRAIPVPVGLSLSQKGREALQTMGNARTFGGSAVGIARSPVPAVAALRTLLDEEEAAAAFDVVLAHGTLAAQLLAVSGMYFADRASFEERLTPYRTMNERVPFLEDGCDGESLQMTVRELVHQEGAVVFRGPKDTLKAWALRNPGSKIVFDIAGGGYPRALRGRRMAARDAQPSASATSTPSASATSTP